VGLLEGGEGGGNQVGARPGCEKAVENRSSQFQVWGEGGGWFGSVVLGLIWRLAMELEATDCQVGSLEFQDFGVRWFLLGTRAAGG
jgi:hypothetical protein